MPPPVPSPHLPQLKLGMCPLSDGGLPPGPYLARLQHLDLRCARCCSLPQVCCAAGAGVGCWRWAACLLQGRLAAVFAAADRGLQAA